MSRGRLKARPCCGHYFRGRSRCSSVALLAWLRREKPVMLQGIPGRETEVELRTGTNLMVARVYIADRRLYQLTALVRLSRGPTTNTWRFLDSLRLNTN